MSIVLLTGQNVFGVVILALVAVAFVALCFLGAVALGFKNAGPDERASSGPRLAAAGALLALLLGIAGYVWSWFS